MRNFKVFLGLSVLFCVLISCDKDDERRERRPGEIRFVGYAYQDTLFYVGGEQRDPSGLDFAQFFNNTRLSWISVERYFGDRFYFEGDSVEVAFDNPPYNTYAYFFQNDTLFALFPRFLSENEYRPGYLAKGSLTELTTRQCLSYMRIYDEEGNVNRGGGFNVSAYESHESMIGYHDYHGLDQMSPNDTLLLINQMKVYR